MKTRTAATTRRPERKTTWRRTLGLALGVALAWFTVTTGGTGASAAARASDAVAETAADATPGYAVEDFNYPQADKIYAEQGILLKRGDGHIVLADCVSDTGQLQVWVRSKANVCFNVTGDSGWLTLELPSVYGIKGNDYTTQVDMTTGTEEKSFDIPKNTMASVGETADEQGRKFMLVEIRTSK